MDSMRCQQCSQTFCSRYNLLRHIRNKHLQHDALFETPRTTLEAALGAHLGAHLGAPGAHLGAPGAHLGAPGAHLGAPGAPPPPQGAPGAHLGAHSPPQGEPGAHLGAPPPSLPQPQRAPLLQEDSKNSIQPTFLLHPFTMMISGPTACGKTTLVKELLQKHSTRIKPTIQRIVWLYKRWQPMYDVIRTTVVPKVEFVQGIPDDLEEDDFFDPRVNNLLILDDLFSEAGKDKRIQDLFTEGSHHRSLSVISINQNLFSNKDPTQRRNCHYLVLFNNPVDRQTIMTLARQMYPGNTEKFQKAFAKATKNPYGYLLVDLKPFTPENDRLKSDVMWPEKSKDMIVLPNQIQEPTQAAIKEDNSYDINHYSVGDQTVHIEQENTMADKGQACDDCLPQKLYKVVKDDGKFNISMHKIRKFLHDQESYSLHKPIRRRFTRNHVISAGIDDLWMADLIDMVKYAEWNEGYKYILVVIDTFSKYVWLRPLKQKTGHEVTEAFKDILSNTDRKPKRLTTDKGQEFRAKPVQKLMEKYNIIYSTTQNETKSSIAERVNLTLKSRIIRYLTYKDSNTYLPILRKVSSSYNKSYQRTIGRTPVSVNANNEEEVRLSTYFAQHPKSVNLNIKLKRFKYKIGDYVRITHLRNVFTRAYDQTYSGEVFRISKRYHRHVLPIYRLIDMQKEKVTGSFYESELEKVRYDPEQSFKIDKIMKTRGKGQNKQHFVQWRHYPKKFNSWIKASDLD